MEEESNHLLFVFTKETSLTFKILRYEELTDVNIPLRCLKIKKTDELRSYISTHADEHVQPSQSSPINLGNHKRVEVQIQEDM